MGQAAYYFFICYLIWYQQGNYLGRRSDSCRRRRSVGILVAPHPMTKCGDHFFVGRNRFDRLLGCFSFLLILGVRWSFLRLDSTNLFSVLYERKLTPKEVVQRVRPSHERLLAFKNKRIYYLRLDYFMNLRNKEREQLGRSEPVLGVRAHASFDLFQFLCQ